MQGTVSQVWGLGMRDVPATAQTRPAHAAEDQDAHHIEFCFLQDFFELLCIVW